MPNRKAFVSRITHLNHGININDDIPEKHHCFVKIGTDTILSAILDPFNNLEPLPTTIRPRFFAQIPDRNNTVYMGELYYHYGLRPSWLVSRLGH